MPTGSLARTLQDFLADARTAVVYEDGELLFDLASARYSLSDDFGKQVLHLWSEERNIVRRVLDAEIKEGTLRLSVQRFGQNRPVKLEFLKDRDRRTPSAKKAAREQYQKLLGRLLPRFFPDHTVEKLSSAVDLERSFGPVYTRGLLRRANLSWALLGVNAQETQSSIDAALTFGLLWLDVCRHDGRGVVEGLKLFAPAGTTAILRSRMAHLDATAAKFLLYEVDERDQAIYEVDAADLGNIETRLVRCPDEQAVRARFADSIRRVHVLARDAEAVVLSSNEMVFRLYGLEFARARLAPEPGTFRPVEQIVFGAAPAEGRLDDANLQEFTNFVNVVVEARRPGGRRDHPLFRMHPERWLERLVLRDITAIEPRLDPAQAYSQVPAFSASDRAMIDVLASTREGRLAVLELKADEDIHLPLQGLDYWARVRWHHRRGEFQQFGYFSGRELGQEPPLLLLVAPALHVHPATDTLLRYLDPAIECTLVGVHENWREELRVIFRKRAQHGLAATA